MLLDRLFTSPSIKRHVAKTITWRIVGTLDTMALGWFITGNPLTGVKIGGLEVITKMILYFFHERAWFKVNYGLPHRVRKDEPAAAPVAQDKQETAEPSLTNEK